MRLRKYVVFITVMTAMSAVWIGTASATSGNDKKCDPDSNGDVHSNDHRGNKTFSVPSGDEKKADDDSCESPKPVDNNCDADDAPCVVTPPPPPVVPPIVISPAPPVPPVVTPPPPFVPTLISVKKMILLQLIPGRYTAYRITVTNRGILPVNVTVTDVLPGKLALGRRVKHATVEKGTITWRFSLQPGQSRSVGFYAWVYKTSRGVVCNTARVRADDGVKARWRDCAGVIPPAIHKPPVTGVTG